MEFWDALEDSQYLDAVASVRDGPKPICKWEIPTDAQLEEWEMRVKARETSTTSTGDDDEERTPFEDDAPAAAAVEPLSLEWYVSAPIGFFFFSSFVKEQHNKPAIPMATNNNNNNNNANNNHASANTTTSNGATQEAPATTSKLPPPASSINESSDANAKSSSLLANQHAFVRMNFLEDLIRLSKLAKTTDNRIKQITYAKEILHYIIPQIDEETGQIEPPRMAQIRECDLHLPRRTIPTLLGCATQAQVEAAVALNHDNTYQSNLVGLKGPLLQEFVAALQDWIHANSSRRYLKSESEPQITMTHDAPNNIITNNETDEATKPTAMSPSDTPQLPNHKNNTMPRAQSADLDEHDATITTTSTTRNSDVPKTSHNYHLAMVAGNAMPLATLDPILQKVQAIIYESLKRDYGPAFQANSNQYCRMRNFLWYQDRRVIYDDFYVMRVLGRGGFGLVSACQKGTTGKLYAMKVMSKRRIKIKKSVQFVINERKALAAVCDSPFIINLKYSLHSDDEVYLILDLMSGGDLGFHLHQRRRFGANQCLYYAARIMLGLQALHDRGYVYRDLKPENCLLAEDGRVKITDLGLATKTSPNLPSGVVGTRGYWAPEMHKRDEAGKRMPYNHVVDWFSFGCCLAEFISGKNPFRSEAAYRFGVERGEKSKDKALDCAIQEMEPEFNPDYFSPDAADLCRRLMDKDPNTRLGAHGGYEEIKTHPWFKTIDWESIITDRRKPPFVPPKDVNAASQHEIGNFADDNSKNSKDIMFDESDEAVYKSWDWINPKAYATEVIEFLIFERELGRPLLPESMNADLCCCIIL